MRHLAAQSNFYTAFGARATAIQSKQAGWSSSLISPHPMLEQNFRADWVSIRSCGPERYLFAFQETNRNAWYGYIAESTEPLLPGDGIFNLSRHPLKR
jgi:hypothetical protein